MFLLLHIVIIENFGVEFYCVEEIERKKKWKVKKEQFER